MDKTVTILGGGESGLGAAILASKNNYNVFVSDSNLIKKERKIILEKNKILYEEGGHSSEKVLSSNLIIKSPGIANEIDLIKKIKKQNIELISEIEFAARFSKAKIIAVTGTNGKTTTSLLIYHILKEAGYDVSIAGNIGNSFAFEISKRDYDYVVLEMSSFQLDNITDLKPKISILLNISSDHLDRYNGHIDAYIASKLRITSNQESDDFLIYNYDDKNFKKINTKAKKIPLSLNQEIKGVLDIILTIT